MGVGQASEVIEEMPTNENMNIVSFESAQATLEEAPSEEFEAPQGKSVEIKTVQSDTGETVVVLKDALKADGETIEYTVSDKKYTVCMNSKIPAFEDNSDV